MCIRVINHVSQGQDQKLAAIDSSDRYLRLSRYYSLKLCYKELLNVHVYSSHYFRVTVNDYGVLVRLNCRKGSFSLKIVAKDGNCYRTLLLVMLISPA